MISETSSQPSQVEYHFRSRRFQIFKEILDQVISDKGVCRILDIGGTPEYWASYGTELNWSKLQVCLLNRSAPKIQSDSITTLAGDARNMKEFGDFSFDVVHSNSVIEHVGRWEDMAAMASEVQRLAPRYFVQTPYFWFPIEPHARFPLLHWMPESWRYRILMKRNCGTWQRQPNLGHAMTAIQSAVLLDKKQMQHLFPEAKIIRERVLGLTKSLIAVR